MPLIFRHSTCLWGIGLLCLLSACVSPPRQLPEAAIAQHLGVQVDSFSRFIEKEFLPLAKAKAEGKQLQELFFQARLKYKRFEWAAEYFTGSTSRFVNGPPVEEISLTGMYRFPPEGLQVIEELLFPTYDAGKQQELIRYLELLLTRCKAYRAYFKGVPMADWQVFDAAKLEVFRIMTLGISGFDNPLTLHSMDECATSLDALRQVLQAYIKQAKAGHLAEKFRTAAQYLREHHDFDTFDRAVFIREQGNILTRELSKLQEQLAIPMIRYNRLLRQEAQTLFEAGAFNAYAYDPEEDAGRHAERVALGEKLFNDPLLSGTHSRSCASCHQAEQAFTDGLVRNTVIGSRELLKRNTPTLYNAALQPFQFYDLRASSLEDQVRDVITNKDEMYGALGRDSVEVTQAISAYVRSLIRLNSRFDLYMRGNDQALNAQELQGFNLFMGKAKCATCHYMPLFNGVLPPKYYSMDAEVIGVPESPHQARIDPDLGRYAVMPFESLRYAFKTPTVRNIGKTAPYMHNGVFQTLEELVDFYDQGGGMGMGISLDNQTLSADSLHLSNAEKKAIIAFMESLEDS